MTSQNIDEDLSDEGAVPAQAAGGPKYEPPYLQAEAFTEEDLASPAFRKMLIDNLRRLNVENDELKRFRENYYQSHERAEVLTEKLAPMAELAVLANISIAVGGIFAGVGFGLISTQSGTGWNVGWAALLLGALSIFSPAIARRWPR